MTIGMRLFTINLPSLQTCAGYQQGVDAQYQTQQCLNCLFGSDDYGVRVVEGRWGRNKAVDPDQIPIEAWRCLGDEGVKWLTCIFNKIFSSAKMPDDWRLSEVIPIYKNKGDVQACSNYRGRSTIDAIHLLKSLMEKYRERQKDLHMAFLDLKKAYDSSAEGLKNRLESWRNALEDNGLRVSKEKTKYLRCDFGRYEVIHQEVDIRIEDRILQPNEAFRYLGLVIHRLGRVDEDVAHCIGAECWPITKAQVNRVEVAKLRMLRWSCGKTMADMIPNGVFRAELDVNSIIEKMREG
nr:retrovirus-related Pol polyprotein LINE-1 [Tanacetum cinerariifolium]